MLKGLKKGEKILLAPREIKEIHGGETDGNVLTAYEDTVVIKFK